MKRYISLFFVLVFILSLSACSCKIDWSNFDLTKRNFGLTEETTATASSTDTEIDTEDSSEKVVFSDDVINYTVPENTSVVYNPWTVVPPEEFRGMANSKLLEIARLNAELSGQKEALAAYPTVLRMTSDPDFSKTLNNIRAWTFGARNYPSEGLSEEDLIILDSLIAIGTDSSEFGARFPALVITNNSENIGKYEDLIISQIVALDSESAS